MFNPFTFDNFSNLTDKLDNQSEASIDPAFDAEMEDVEYHVAQFRRDVNQD
jgi:hypothetical protein